MTVVAFDLKSIAFDSGGTYGGVVNEVHKFRQMKDGTLIVFAGSEPTAHLMLDMYDVGVLFTEWPAGLQTCNDTRATLIRVNFQRRTVEALYHAPSWVRQHNKMAWGSGSEVAFGAMMAGADAKRAAKIASKYAVGCAHKVHVCKVR